MSSRLAGVARGLFARWSEARLPPAARAKRRADRAGLPLADPGAAAVRSAAMAWLARAQDCSASADGGVARDFSLRTGWATSYPETTGYIVPTFLDYAALTGDAQWRDRAVRMLAWLAAIQLPSGAIQGGRIDSVPVAPVPFNTGQVLLGFAAGERVLGGFRGPLRRAADWLVDVQDPDGCWRRYPSPFAGPGDKTYDTHIAWGLLEAARVEPGRGYAEAALANVTWALTQQRPNGFLDRCCLTDPSRPLTHTLGYALRGIVEAWRFRPDARLLEAARRTADGLLAARRPDGSLPGQLTAAWTAAADWACLTGTVQVAHSWLLLHGATGDSRYREAGLAANAWVRRTVAMDGPADVRGAVAGSFPSDGEYCQDAYPNWAAKFLVDSLSLECELMGVANATAAA